MKEKNIAKDLKRSLCAKTWHKIGIKHHHGIALSLASLRTHNSYGIGEFLDLIPLIDWCKKVGFDVIQLLPLNDSGFDPSPYNAISSCALNPIHLSLHKLPFIDENKELLQRLDGHAEIKSPVHVPYLDVLNHKLMFLYDYVSIFGKKISSSNHFKEYVKKSAWLTSYALFKCLKDKLGQSYFRSWPKELKDPSDEELKKLKLKYKHEIEFYTLLQFLCFDQLSTVKKEANRNKIFIKGDIPILISPDSADVWSSPDLFIHDFSAGAPPDFYNKDGQYWGFPLYNWHRMHKTNLAWWQQRLSYAENFYNIYRLDHVVGFFRIWAILLNQPPKEGKFVPPDESQWEEHGRNILKMLISFTDMLPIAEDLGTVPDMVRPVLETLGICGTKVMRWERDWEGNKEFISIDKYPPISMTCLSTHDSPTLAQWWRDFPEEVAPLCKSKNWQYEKDFDLQKRIDLLKDSHNSSSLFHINLLQEYLDLIPQFSYQNIDDERINIPGKILSTNWTYKFIPSAEEILSNLELQKKIKELFPFEKT